jgi:hypothetical protein
MKRLVLYLIIISTSFSCSSSLVVTNKRAEVGEAWKISDDAAQKMITRLDRCGLFKPCHNNSKIMDPNNEQYQWLIKEYRKENISLIDARYRHADQNRYGALRGMGDAREKYKVRGYKTQIVKVVLTNGSMFASENYYDCFTVCPPPEPCGSQ